ncbi:MAG: SatD family protein [Terracoccus sp.]
MALIGDLVGSRRARDRQGVHDRLQAALTLTNDRVAATHPLAIPAGDEFQGVYPTLGAALEAAFRLRLGLGPQIGVRFGIGRGAIETLDPVRGIQDGPAYWSARAAIESAAERAGRARTHTARTAYASTEDDPATVAAVGAALDCLDFVVGSLSETSHEILGGLMDGTTQQAIATQLGLSPSAVSQRIRRDGIAVALEAMTALTELP